MSPPAPARTASASHPATAEEDTMIAADPTTAPHPVVRSARGDVRPLVSPAPGAAGTSPRRPEAPAAAAAPARRSTAPRPTAALPDQAELVRRARREEDREDQRAVRSLAAVVALACVEAEVGRRQLRDLAAWLDLPVYDKVARRIDLLERTGARLRTAVPPRPIGARVCEVAAGRVEASASIRCGDRVRAIALRLERRLSRWRVVAVEIG